MSVWISIPLASIFCYSALLAVNFRRGSHGKVNAWFSLYLFSMIVWSLGSFLARFHPGADTLLWNRVLSAGSTAMPFIFFSFVEFFLGKERKKLLIFSLFFFIVTQAANALGLTIKSAYAVDGKLINQFGPAVFLPILSWPLYIGLSASQLIIEYRSTRDIVYRNRLKYLLAVIIVIFFGSMTNMTSLSVYPVDIGFNVVSAGLIGYAILRYHLLDLSVVIRKSLLYSIPTMIIGALYFLAITFIWQLFTTFTNQQIFFLSLLVAVLSAVVAQPIRDKAQLWVDRVFFREKHDISLMLQRVSRTASTVLDIHLLTNMILKEINANLHVSRSAFFLKSIDQDDFELSTQEGLEIDPPVRFRKDHPIVQVLTINDRAISRMDIEIMPVFLSLWGQEREELVNLGGELFVPVKAKGVLVGILLIGPKRSGETYSLEDHATLITLASQTAVAIENARLFAEARQRTAEMTQLNQVIQAELSERMRAEKALKESEERFRRLAENAPDLIYRYRTIQDCGYEFISTAINEIIGYSPAEFYTDPELQYKILYPDDLPVFLDMIQGKHARRPITIRLVGKDGSIVWTEQHIVPIHNSDGALVAIEGIARDITRRKQDEEELAARVNQLEKHNREIIILNEMGDVLQACQNRQEVYPILQKYLKQLFITESGMVYVLDPAENRYEMAASWGETSLNQASFESSNCWALRRGKPHLMEGSDVELQCKHLHYSNIHSHLCIPMMAQGEALGTITLIKSMIDDGEEKGIPPSEQQLAMTVSEHIALALANLRLNETLREQAIRDPLTDLFNRRYMVEMLDRELARANRKNSALGIIFIDIDHFKQINDLFGHDMGDRVLHEIGKFLKANTRKEDIACRYGGEEFILILPDVSLEAVCQRAEEIRVGVKQVTVGLQDLENTKIITLSLGVSMFPKNGQTVEALMRSADVALYQAKHAGRDCYQLAE